MGFLFRDDAISSLASFSIYIVEGEMKLLIDNYRLGSLFAEIGIVVSSLPGLVFGAILMLMILLPGTQKVIWLWTENRRATAR